VADESVLEDTEVVISENDYSSYINEFSYIEAAKEDIVLYDEAAYTDQIEKTVAVVEDGLYELQLTYISKGSVELKVEFMIDGAYPFASAERISFPLIFTNSDKERFDGNGNEIAPEQILYNGEYTYSAREYTGVSETAYRFALTAGEHTVSIKRLSGEAEIRKAVLAAATQADAYKKPSKIRDNKEVIVIEGEDASVKSGRDLIPLIDRSHAEVYPSDPLKSKINYIGGSNWSSPGDTISWDFEVEQAGYYSFGAFYRQKAKIGAASYRSLTIDGVSPFAEAQRIKFTYSPSWKTYTFGNEEPYYFYLDKGPHTLTLAVTSGEMAEVYSRLKSTSSDLGDLYVDITMVVGETVDLNRSYELFNQIPNFNKRLKAAIKELKALIKKIEDMQEKTSGSTVSTLSSAVETLQKMLDNPYSAHQYKSAYYTAYTNLGALVGEMTDMPLDIDRIFLAGAKADTSDFGASFFEKLSFSVRRFLATFSEDYDAVSASKSDEALTLWVNWGRDQAQVLTALIRDSFTSTHNIEVKVEVVNATLIQGILAGKGPDCILHMVRTEPINLAMRGALEPLSQFEDLDAVLEQFNADGETPYIYKDKVYALPDTQTFEMLFVRTDILERMGLEIPKTWEEFADVTTALQRSNLQVHMPQTMYLTMLAQEGLPLYDTEKGITTLTQLEQIRCFKTYTDWFVRYKLPKTMGSFFERFRIGAAPMGIFDFTLSTQLETAAPEIEGRWTAVKLPATVRDDGKLYGNCSGGGTGCAITKLSKNPENAWKFLKWWVSEDTQRRYSSDLESLLGPLGRVATSNNTAFSKLGWNAQVLPEIEAQRKEIVNFPELPGGYYVNRSIDQAFWNVVEANANVNDTMIKWGGIADTEMLRKQAEYE